MRKTKKNIHINTLILFVGALASSVLRCVAIMTDLDPKYGYFREKSLINAASWVLLAACILIAAEALFNMKRKNLAPDFQAPVTYIPAGLCGASLLFVAKYLFESFYKLTTGKDSSPLTSGLALISGIFALAAVAAFAAFVICRGRLNTVRALFTMAISIFALLFASHIYFDTSLPLNAPNKITDLVAYIFVSLFFLFEARISLGREKWNLYTLFGGMAALLCAYSSIPSLIAFFAEGYIISTGIYESILTFTLFIFITARLILTNELRKDEPCALVSALADEARERDARIEAADKNFRELISVLNKATPEEAQNTDSDQLSINDILSEESNTDSNDTDVKDTPASSDAEEPDARSAYDGFADGEPLSDRN